VTVVGGILDSVSVTSEQRIGPIRRIVPFQFENSAQISFLIDGDITDSKAYPEKGGILVSLRSARAIDLSQAYEPTAEYRKFLIDRIVIDPGHGGKHPGAVGRSGLQEKDVNLDIARRLKKLLAERLDIDVLLTREGDEFVGLKERTQFANSREGKLFISIHQNGNDDKRVRGYSMYLLGREKTKQALEVAQKENSVIELEESKEAYEDYKNASYILNAIAQNQYVKESEDLAQMVGSSLGRGTHVPRFGEGVYQAGLYVLIGAAMPSILVETAFITNLEEERLLRTKSFLQKIAESLSDSIIQFKEKYERGIKQQSG
jgi:N-acetylmuramoyl-L-alanine amidase